MKSSLAYALLLELVTVVGETRNIARCQVISEIRNNNNLLIFDRSCLFGNESVVNAEMRFHQQETDDLGTVDQSCDDVQDSVESSESFTDTRILHLTFHDGCRQDLAYVGKQLGLNISSERFFVYGNTTDLNVNPYLSAKAWQENGKRWSEFDAIIISDTAPVSRVFLEGNRWLNKTLIIWVCNRFNYAHHHPDGSSDGFPDPEFYRLFGEAWTRPNVFIAPYTQFEAYFAKMKHNIYFGELPPIQPIGLGSLSSCGNKNLEITSSYPAEVPSQAQDVEHARSDIVGLLRWDAEGSS